MDRQNITFKYDDQERFNGCVINFKKYIDEK